MRLLSSILALSLALYANAGIYPEGHFDISHRLTVDTFDDTIQSEIDAGKTIFVRWIASEG